MKPFSTYPEDRAKLLELARRILTARNVAVEARLADADALAEQVRAILEDEQYVTDADD